MGGSSVGETPEEMNRVLDETVDASYRAIGRGI